MEEKMKPDAELTEEELDLVLELDSTTDQQYDKSKNDQLFADLHNLVGIPL